MKIAIIDFYRADSAPEQRVIDILETWVEDKFLIVRNSVENDRILALSKKENVEVLCIPRVVNYGKYADLISFITNTRKIVKTVNSMNPDLIIISNPRLFYLSLFLKSKKMILMFRDYWRRKNPLSYIEYIMARYFVKRVDMIISVTNSLREKIIDELKIPSEKVFLLPNSCDTDKFNRRSAKESLKEELSILDKKIIIYVGALDYLRRLDRFVDAFSRLEENYAFLVVGEGYEKESLEKQSSDYVLNDRIIFLGKLPHEKVIELLKISDVAINSFIKTKESEVSFPVKTAEYLSAGLPIISDNVGEVANVIEENEIGLVIYSAEPKEIAEKIEYLLKNDEIRTKMSQNAIEYANKNLDIRKNLEKLRTKLSSLFQE